MPTTDALRTVAVATVVLAVVTSVSVAGLLASPGFAGTAEAGHGAETGNYTVVFPEAHDQYPRSENPDGTHSTTIHHYAGFTPELYEKAGTPKGTENLSWIWVESQDIDFSQCTTDNTRAFGIDRDGDDPGTNTDVPLLSYREDSSFNDNSIYVDFFENNDDLTAPPRQDQGGEGQGQGEGREDGDRDAEVYPDDEIIAVQEECYGMPEEPGWYQINAGGNGTGFNGQEGTIVQTSHYFYVCTCDNESAAREELGPPPSERDGNENTDEQTPTDTGDEDSPTETPDPDGDDDQQQQQDETPDTETTETTGGDTTSPETGTTSTGDGGGGGDGEQQAAVDESDGNETPTQGNGPGLGVLATLAALAALAGLAGRRRRR